LFPTFSLGFSFPSESFQSIFKPNLPILLKVIIMADEKTVVVGCTPVHTLLIVLCLLAIVGILALKNPVTQINPTITTQPNPNALYVSGNSQISVVPDKATIMMSIVTEGKTAALAQSENKNIANQVIADLKKAGVADEDIETSQYVIEKVYEWNKSLEKSVETGYRASHTLKVTTKNMDNVGSLIDTAISSGANEVNSVSFGLTKEKEKEVRSQALTLATTAAKEKAQNIASTAGVTLGTVLSISESYYYSPAVYNVRAESGGYAKDSTAISPMKVEVTGTISMTYEIK